MIQFEKVTKRYPGGQEALQAIDFKMDAGEMAFLTGHSGAGKSTLLKLIALIELPTSGHVFINGRSTTTTPRWRIPLFRRQIGMVFQDHKLLYDRSVFNNVALPLIVASTPRQQIAKRVRAALDQVGLLHKENAMPMALSTGEQQRVGIARAVVRKPALLIADEPTGNLDPELSQEIMAIFTRFSEVGVTVLVASHDQSLISSLNRRLITLDQGRMVDPGIGANADTGVFTGDDGNG
ncbi:MAG: cell division ATP-binding protein FtsE [Gammaproteobacteria bacterium]|nr:cell division ATP-binding protein FtsE [Gammaproteobacteria bacterium]